MSDRSSGVAVGPGEHGRLLEENAQWLAALQAAFPSHIKPGGGKRPGGGRKMEHSTATAVTFWTAAAVVPTLVGLCCAAARKVSPM